MKRAISLVLAIIMSTSALFVPVAAFSQDEAGESAVTDVAGESAVTDEAAATVTEPEAEEAEETEAVSVEKIEPLYPAKKKFSIAVKQKRKITVTLLPKNADNTELKWTSADKSVAKVNKDGVVKGVKEGKVKIQANATDGSGKRITFTVTVKKRKSGNSASDKKFTEVSAATSVYTYAEMKKDIKSLQKKYPEIMSYSVLGKTVDSRNIYEIVIGNPECENHILFQYTIHAREYINSLLAMRQLESLCANYYTGTCKGKYYSEIFDKVCIHVIPMMNPDGVTISQKGPNAIRDKKVRKYIKKLCKKYGGSSRSYYKRWKSNANGVDLNRNFNISFNRKPKVNHPGNAFFKGPSASSEPETKILIKAFKTIKPKVVVSYHSQGEVIYWNFAQTGSQYKQSKALFNAVHALTGYRDATPRLVKDKYKTEPCFADWLTHKQKTPTITIETGRVLCPIGIGYFPEIWRENKYVVPRIAYYYAYGK